MRVRRGPFERRVFRKHPEYDLAFGNPLLTDGLVCEALGVRCAGELVLESLDDAARCEVPSVFGMDHEHNVDGACCLTRGSDIREYDLGLRLL